MTNESKERKLRRVLSMAISLDAAIEDTMAAMVNEEMELHDRKDRRAFDELEFMHSRLLTYAKLSNMTCLGRRSLTIQIVQ